ncbi:hypothetical protein Q8A73_003422 [Channa argus]|nr:hypothetical protein Q8A73_003422 [Channa argus]
MVKEVPWGEIRGKVWGPDHGGPVLCLHSCAKNCWTFNTLIPLLLKALQLKEFSIIGRNMMWPVAELSDPVPSGEIRGKVWGPDHGRPVLCLYGWADNCGTFNTLIPLLPNAISRGVAMATPTPPLNVRARRMKPHAASVSCASQRAPAIFAASRSTSSLNSLLSFPSSIVSYLPVSSSIFCPCILPSHAFALIAVMSWLFLDWFVPLYLLVSVLVLAGFGACLYFLEPGLQDAHKWSNKTVRHHPLVTSVNCRDDDSNALI